MRTTKRKRPPRPGEGRPGLVTGALIREFRTLPPPVMFLETIGPMLGVSRIKWRVWLKRGRGEAERLAADPTAKPKPSELLYRRFYRAYQKQMALCETWLVKLMKVIAKKKWTAAAWPLERRYPVRWGRIAAEICRLRKALQ